MGIEELVRGKLVGLEEGSATLLEISEVGSVLLKEDMSRSDYDYVVLCSEFKSRKRIVRFMLDGIRYDLMIYDKEEYLKQITFTEYSKEFAPRCVYQAIWAALRRAVYGNAELAWSIFDYETEYREFIKQEIIRWGFSSEKNVLVSGKMFVAAYLALKVFENKSLTITEEMKEIAGILYRSSSVSEEVRSILIWIGNQLDLTWHLN